MMNRSELDKNNESDLTYCYIQNPRLIKMYKLKLTNILNAS
jgi:hypothetical protein